MHDHLHPREVGLIRMMPVIIWSNDTNLQEEAGKYLTDEYGEYLNIIPIEQISTIEEIQLAEKIEVELEKYNYHIIKIEAESAELVLLNEEKHKFDFEDLEELLDKFGRILIAFYHENV